MFKLGKKSRRNLKGVHPDLINVVHLALSITKVDFMVFEGVRSLKKQRLYYKKGRTKTMDSYHLYGLAVDLIPYRCGKITWGDRKAFKEVARSMKVASKQLKVKVDWGYKLWGWDMPHYQMTGMKKRYDIRKLK